MIPYEKRDYPLRFISDYCMTGSWRRDAPWGAAVVISATTGWAIGTRQTALVDWLFLVAAIGFLCALSAYLTSQYRLRSLKARHAANDKRGDKDLTVLSSSQAGLLRAVVIGIASGCAAIGALFAFMLKGHPIASASSAVSILAAGVLIPPILRSYDIRQLAVTALKPAMQFPRAHPADAFRTSSLDEEARLAMIAANTSGSEGRAARELMLLADHPQAYWPDLGTLKGRYLRQRFAARLSILSSYVGVLLASGTLAFLLSCVMPFPFFPALPGPAALFDALDNIVKPDDAPENGDTAPSDSEEASKDQMGQDESPSDGNGGEEDAQSNEAADAGSEGGAKGQQADAGPTEEGGAGQQPSGTPSSAPSNQSDQSSGAGSSSAGSDALSGENDQSPEPILPTEGGGEQSERPGEGADSRSEGQNGNATPGEGSGAAQDEGDAPSSTLDDQSEDGGVTDADSGAPSSGDGQSSEPEAQIGDGANGEAKANDRQVPQRDIGPGTGEGANPADTKPLAGDGTDIPDGIDITAVGDPTAAGEPNSVTAQIVTPDERNPDLPEVTGVFMLDEPAEQEEGVDIQHDTQILLASPGGLPDTIEATPMTGAMGELDLQDVDLPPARQKVPSWINDLFTDTPEVDQ